MFTETIWVTYICKKCTNHSVSEQKHIDLSPIIPLDALVDTIQCGKHAHCGTHGCQGHITHVECYIEAGHDEYGSDYGGYWTCKLGHVTNLYPIPLRRSVENKGIIRYKNDERYKIVTTMGYPWRCPVCKSILVYIRDPIG